MAARNPVFIWIDVMNKHGSFLWAGIPKFQSVRGLEPGACHPGPRDLDLVAQLSSTEASSRPLKLAALLGSRRLLSCSHWNSWFLALSTSLEHSGLVLTVLAFHSLLPFVLLSLCCFLLT